MPTMEITIEHQSGLHARPAGEFVKLAATFPCEIQVRNKTEDGDFVNAKSILSVLTLGVNQGVAIELEAEGDQADQALQALQGLIKSNFGEDH